MADMHFLNCLSKDNLHLFLEVASTDNWSAQEHVVI